MIRIFAPLLALTLVAAPVFATEHAHHGHAAAASRKPQQVTSQTMDAGKMTVTLLDARAYFDDLHRGHLNHPGIPTHQLLVKGLLGKGEAPLKGVKVVNPAGVKTDPPLRAEQGAQVADIELRKPGRYTFELMKRDGSVTRWSYTVR